ncbi:MAG: crotonase/enoyl-CoA hydratase family protein [Pseudomonadales bacterium]|nr:crotonase/enoyl-CoA hydratase family protein [Pseudomonadales bacterium]
MGYQAFNVEIENNIAHVQLSRPEKRNSMDRAFWRELPEIINDIDDNARARVIVISSTGPHFSAGLDLTMFSDGADASTTRSEDQKMQRAAASYHNILMMQKSFNCLEECRVPVLVAIQGGAFGGGVDLSVACDMRYATEDAFLIIQEINIALTADVGTFPRLVKLIPEGIVRELAYTGRRFTAAEAKDAGLINRVYADHDTMMADVMSIAHEIASKAPVAVYGSKRMINYARDHSTADGLDYISIWNSSMINSPEIMEALTAKKEGREATFVDLPPRWKHG